MTATPSLRRRLILAVLGLLSVLLIALASSVYLLVDLQARHDLHDRLMAAAARADALNRDGVTPAQLVAQTSGGGIRIRLIDSNGRSYGDARLPLNSNGPLEPPPPPPAPPAGIGLAPPPPPPPPDATATAITHRLPDHGVLILVADTTATTALLKQLRLILGVASVSVLLVASVATAILIGSALRPLDRLTALAGAITAGDRGRRLKPDRPNTELGRAATSFDNMLDALEDSERRASQAAETAEHAEAATRQFLADAAHELRTPIAGIHAGAEQIVATATQTIDDPDATQQRRRAHLVLTEARRAGRLIADMIDLSRIEAGLHIDWQDCDLVTIADDERLRTQLLAPTVNVVRSGVASLHVVTDPHRVMQILANLTDNARRHSPDGGTITLDVGSTSDQALITVSDTGAGIPPNDRERVFHRLVRLDEARSRDQGGAGLGLPIARELARALGGDLLCRDHQPGAHFTLYLPLVRGPEDAA